MTEIKTGENESYGVADGPTKFDAVMHENDYYRTWTEVTYQLPFTSMIVNKRPKFLEAMRQMRTSIIVLNWSFHKKTQLYYKHSSQ